MSLAPTPNLISHSSEQLAVNSNSLCQSRIETTDELNSSLINKKDLGPENLAISCADCHTKKTPLWRRAENGDILCNACGLFTKTKNVRRKGCKSKVTETEDIEVAPSQASKGTCPGDGNCNGTGGARACDGCPAYHQQNDTKKKMSCFNCHTITTPLWRRDAEGNNICNACGLYYKINNSHRPVTLKTAVIKRRRRMVAPKDKKDSPQIICPSEAQSIENTTESVHDASLPEVPSIEDYPESYFNQDRVTLTRPLPPPSQSLQFARPRVIVARESEEPSRIPKLSPISPTETSDTGTSPYNRPYPGISARHTTPTHSPLMSSERTLFPPNWSSATPQLPASVSYIPSSSSSSVVAPPPVDVNNLLAERNKIQLEIDSLTQHLNNSSAVLSSMKNVLKSIDLILANQNTSSLPSVSSTINREHNITLPSIQYLTSGFTHHPSETNYQRPYYYPPQAE